jgi:uncharacterized membrane protein YphA (DoxX/SURF4 family)
MLGRFLAILRIVIGLGFIGAGILILRDADLLYGGLLLRLSELGRPAGFYQKIINRYIELNQTPVAMGAAIISILVGVALVLGFLVSLAVLAGAALVMNFALATMGGRIPEFSMFCAGSLALLLLGRLGAGLTWGLDGWLVGYLKEWLVLFPLRLSAPQR